MKTLFFIGVLITISFSFRNYYSGENYCASLVISKVELQVDSLKAKLFNDSVSVIYVTMKNFSKTRLTGPDYVLLTVMQGKDTIAGVAINGIPLYNQPRSYPAFCRKRLRVLPDLKTLRFSLEHYCEDLKVMPQKNKPSKN